MVVRMGANIKGNVLIVDDEPNAVKVLSAILTEDGYKVYESMDVDSAVKIIARKDLDAIITEKMPGRDGTDLFEYVNEKYPHIPVVFLTAYGTVDSAVSTMTQGAFYYFIKPPDYVKLKSILERAVEHCRLKKEIEVLKKKLSDESGEVRLVGISQEMRNISEVIEVVKDSDSSVLICGDTGTGKEVIARSLHYRSKRKARPFVSVNCAAIPRELIESELFGYEKGAFTGAIEKRIGRFEEASGGTLFLDEIGELELSLQAKLLRVLQERELERLGSNKKVKVDFRLVCSTNRYIQNEVKANKFREDLFYRINVVQIKVPPLRKRKEDVIALVSEFLREFSTREKKNVTVSAEVMNILQDYDWPGNIRQLRNTIERAVIFARGKEVGPQDLPQEILFDMEAREARESSEATVQAAGTLRQVEAAAIKDAIRKCNGNKSKASKLLGISRKAFYRRLREYALFPSQP